MGFAIGLGWAALMVVAPIALAAAIDPEARPATLRRLRGWLAVFWTLARRMPSTRRNQDTEDGHHHQMPPSALSLLSPLDQRILDITRTPVGEVSPFQLVISHIFLTSFKID